MDAQALVAQCALHIEVDTMSDAVFASALGCVGGIATWKAGVQSTAWRGMVGASRGSGRSARADRVGGAVASSNDEALD